MLSQLSRYGTIHKLQIDDIRMSVTTRFHIEGSVLADTLQSRPLEFDSRIEVDSPEPPERIARLLRTAENSCYVMQSLRLPVRVNRSFALNGEAMEPTLEDAGGRAATP